MNGSVVQLTLISAVGAALPVLFASLGALLNERSGVINVGVEGVMLIGAVGGYIVGVKTGSLWFALAGGAAFGAVFTLVFFGVPVLLLRSPQILTGFGLWLIGTGVSDQLGQDYTSAVLRTTVPRVELPLLHSLPFVGKIFFDQTVLAYIGVALAVLYFLVLSRTRHGRNIRAIGEDPASAHASGIPVLPWRAVYVSLGGALMGIGGAILSVVIAKDWHSQMTAGRGFVAFALVIFVGWRPLGLIWASYLFGVLLLLGGVGSSQGWSISSEFLDMAPYLFTIAVLLVRGWREVRGGSSAAAPAALGLPFVRGQR